MNKIAVEIKASCPCPLATRFITNSLKNKGIKILSHYYNNEGFLVLEFDDVKTDLVKIINELEFIAKIQKE